jgi:sec-independent protein translocase protein TatA
MGDLLQPTHLMVIGILLLVLFGARRLPELGKGLGEGLKGFKNSECGVFSEPLTEAQRRRPRCTLRSRSTQCLDRSVQLPIDSSCYLFE